MKKFILLCFLLVTSLTNAQTMGPKWVKGFGDSLYDEGNQVVTDASGNVYMIGNYFYGAPNVSRDVFITKTDPNGKSLWSRSFGAEGFQYDGVSITVDGNGNVYTTGSFSGTADFDPGSGTYNLTATSSQDIFISKLNTSGDFVWAKALGGNDNERGTSIVADGAGNIY